MRATSLPCAAMFVLCAALSGCAKGESDQGQGSADAGHLADAGPRVDAGPDVDSGAAATPVTLTQSTSLDVVELNSVACFDELGGFTSEASYFRVFDLASEGITTPLAVTQVSFGIETAASGDGGGQPAQVKIHALQGTLSNDNLMAPVGTASIDVADQELEVLVVPVTGTVPVGAKLVVEVHVPDGEPDGNAFFIGTNAAGESGPTYVRDTCGGAEEPIPLEDLEVPDVHWVLSVAGTK